MAIRPVDLQLAYLAAPQNAAQVNNAQNAPQSAQQAAQAAFAAQLQKREETIEQTQPVHGSVIQANPDGSNLKATLLIELPDPAERIRRLSEYRGFERHCWMRVQASSRMAFEVA